MPAIDRKGYDLPAREHGAQFFGRCWPGQQIALNVVAPLLAQNGQLRLRFDTFGYRCNIQSMCERDHATDQPVVLRILSQSADKTSINLQALEAHASQQTQRRVARAEIV